MPDQVPTYTPVSGSPEMGSGQAIPSVAATANGSSNPSTNQSPKKPWLKWLSFSLIGIGAIAGLTYAGFTLYKNQFQTQPAPQSALTFVPPAQVNPDIANWTYVDGAPCDVQFLMPPDTELYKNEQSGEYWEFPRGRVRSNFLSLFSGQQFDQVVAMYAPQNQGTSDGQFSAAVAVTCLENTGNEPFSIIFRDLQAELEKNVGQAVDTGETLVSFGFNPIDVNRWGLPVVDLTLLRELANDSGEQRYVMTDSTMIGTPNTVYEVQLILDTDDAFVKETATLIFENLKFPDQQ